MRTSSGASVSSPTGVSSPFTRSTGGEPADRWMSDASAARARSNSSRRLVSIPLHRQRSPPAGASGNRRVGPDAHREDVLAVAEHVDPVGDDGVVSRPTVDDVTLTVVGPDVVGALARIDGVVPGVGDDEVAAGARANRVVAVARPDLVRSGAAADVVVSPEALDHVLAVAGADHVVAGVRDDQVAVPGADGVVGAVRAVEALAAERAVRRRAERARVRGQTYGLARAVG